MERMAIRLAVLLCWLLVGCSAEDAHSQRAGGEDHVWKDQVEAIDQAREVEGVLRESARRERTAPK